MKKLVYFYLFLLLFAVRGFSQLTDPLEQCKQSVMGILPYIPGWCSQTKATAMMDLIFEVRPEVCVEIGVFGGSSLFPTASALKCLGKGVVYAIDPWDNYECIKYYINDDAHKMWWASVNLNDVHNSFINLIRTHQLYKHCIVVKETSEKASSIFETIDILHIDGNHCDESAFLDVLNYAPKLKVGGHIWFNGWSLAPKAFEYLKKTCYVRKVIDGGQCILLEKISAGGI